MKKAILLLVLITSQFVFANNTNQASTLEVNTIQTVRLQFTSPNGASRELVLGFTSDNSASDGVDYGYDATVSYPFPNDLNWLIENDRYVIQGVGAFDNTKQYLFGMYSETTGNAKIELTGLENFDSAIEVFIYDALLNTYTQINDAAYENNIDAGEYLDRFYITFNKPAEEDNSDDDTSEDGNGNDKEIKVQYVKGLHQLIIKSDKNNLINEVEVFDYDGNTLQTVTNINNKKAKINLNTDTTNLILHIVTENKTYMKQIVINN